MDRIPSLSQPIDLVVEGYSSDKEIKNITVAETNEIVFLTQKIWDYHYLNRPLKKADCIIGLGSYDLRVADRCAELYFEEWAPFIIFTGGLGNWTKNIWDRSEAEIFTEHTLLKGVPSDKIKLEKNQPILVRIFHLQESC